MSDRQHSFRYFHCGRRPAARCEFILCWACVRVTVAQPTARDGIALTTATTFAPEDGCVGMMTRGEDVTVPVSVLSSPGSVASAHASLLPVSAAMLRSLLSSSLSHVSLHWCTASRPTFQHILHALLTTLTLSSGITSFRFRASHHRLAFADSS